MKQLKELHQFDITLEGHIKTIIEPALNRGKLIISDRFCDSTFVYQCYLNKFGINKGIMLHKKLVTLTLIIHFKDS